MQKSIKALKILIAESVENAKSGHPGAGIALSEIGIALWCKTMSHNPINPSWINRDRFILSNGHAAILHYSLLHLTGYEVSIDDLKSFRKLHSITPGHPEYGNIGIETSTGPLGQGFANGVGMALASKLLAKIFNRTDYELINHFVYVVVGDGCLMEGISHECASLAGTLELSKLVVIYDSNNISIDGSIENWFTEDIKKRFEAYNWQVIGPIDGHDFELVVSTLESVKSRHDQRPQLIICNTVIANGAPTLSGKSQTHGSPLGINEIKLMREKLDWNFEPFEIPNEIYAEMSCVKHGQDSENKWNIIYDQYKLLYPELVSELERRLNHDMPENWDEFFENGINQALNYKDDIATRVASQSAINYFSKLPELFGSSADLTPSNLSKWNSAVVLNKLNDFSGNYMSFGVREFAMTAIINGMYLYGGFRPFGGTFLVFSDYARNAIRMASLMNVAPIFLYTHDSIGVGEDGPTHQPIEHIASLRIIPNLNVWRPADIVESYIAWGHALSQNQTPSALIFSRQNVKNLNNMIRNISDIKKGGYKIYEVSYPEITIIATGSEVQLAIQVAKSLTNANVVSMPCLELFETQSQEYKKLLFATNKIVVIEAGVSDGWYKYAGKNGLIISIDEFGLCCSPDELFEHFGFTVDKILEKIIYHNFEYE